jgi:transcriptional regulator of arginine metabolism
MTAVMAGAPRTMTARRARITAIITTATVGSQDELGALLAAEGIRVTQATLSRDLDAIGAVKEVDDTGRSHYVLADHGSVDTSIPTLGTDAALARVAGEVLVRAESAGNIAVLHTPPGAAQFLAGHLDRSASIESVGSVAGDDTIILVMRTPRAAKDLCTRLLRLAEQRRTT